MVAPLVMVTPSLPKKETKLRGLPHGVSADAEEKLWGEYAALRPSQHRERLQHFISLEFGLARLLAGWVPACGSLEWKLELPRFLFEHLQHARRLRERLEELPGGAAAISPSATVQRFFQAISQSECAVAYVRGYVEHTLPLLAQAYEAYLARCDEILDAPTVYILTPLVAAHRDLASRGRRLLDFHALPINRQAVHDAYLTHLQICLQRANRLEPSPGAAPAPEFPALKLERPAGPNPARRAQDAVLKLREGFPTSKDGNPTHRTLREIIYHNATEWQVIDPMCEVFHAVPKMPLDFFVDFSRHIWDECRHARMGFRRLRELGYDPLKDFEWSHGADRVQVLEEYFAGLTLVGESCSFTRKKGSIALFLQAGDPRSAMLPEVDCVDEQLHVSFGSKWVTAMYELVRGESWPKDAIARDRRAATIERLKNSPKESDAKNFLNQMDEKSRQALVNTFSGFCGAIEFNMDLTVY